VSGGYRPEVRQTGLPSFAVLSTAEFTYPQVGATRDPHLPVGYDHVLRDVVVGRGSDAFEAAADGLFDWRMHRRKRSSSGWTTPAWCISASVPSASRRRCSPGPADR